MATKKTRRILTIDIGGTGIKMLLVGAGGKPAGERERELTPKPSTPKAVLGVIREMLARQRSFSRVSVGFPGVVVRGVVRTAPNLGTRSWTGFDLEGAIRKLTRRPARVINDADLQGLGVIRGRGVELVLTLGTGLGSGLYLDGRLVPNLELAHHPFREGRTYEELVSDAELRRVGKKRWRKRVARMLEQIEPIFNYDLVHLGGGNARKLDRRRLPGRARLFGNVEGMTGGVRLWQDGRGRGRKTSRRGPGASRS